MNSVNLIPGKRLVLRQRRIVNRRWGWVCAILIGVWVTAGLATRSMWMPDSNVIKDLAQTGSRIEQLAIDLTRQVAQLEQVRAELGAGRAISTRSDWSVVLAIVSQCAGDDLVLRKCQLSPIWNRDASPGLRSVGNSLQRHGLEPVTASQWILQLAGVGKTLEDVSQFVLRLEQTNLFDRVQVVDSGQEIFLGEPATSFILVLNLGDRT